MLPSFMCRVLINEHTNFLLSAQTLVARNQAGSSYQDQTRKI